MQYKKVVRNWLLIGLACLVIQVIVGGITRLTESGLSITEWEPIKGAFPPLSNDGWIEEFNKYKETPQYSEINEGMSLSDFKFIYFWEFIHRQWARIMGLIFLFPFIFFYRRKLIDRVLMRKLGVVILLAILAASFGWIMVASGLIERPWVNAYKLSFHLCIAFSVYVALLYAYFHTKKEDWKVNEVFRNITWFRFFIGLMWLQIFLGGMMSGMRIGVAYPTWPDMNGEYFPSVLSNIELYTWNNFNVYDASDLMPALIQFLHRGVAYLLFCLGAFLCYSIYVNAERKYKKLGMYLFASILLQVVLGIITVMSCIGEIPILWGVLHQGGALVLITVTYMSYLVLKNDKV